jgi:acetyl-CoA synthetase
MQIAHRAALSMMMHCKISLFGQKEAANRRAKMNSGVLGQPAPYAKIARNFAWSIPEFFNIAQMCCDNHAEKTPDKPALWEVQPDFSLKTLTYGALAQASSQLAHALIKARITRGDRVAILLPQSRYVAIAHMAIQKIGAIALPLASLFGVDAIAYRLENAGARLILTDSAGLAKLRALPERPRALETMISIDGDEGEAIGLHRFIEGMLTRFETIKSRAEDPALMIYTSGTTGQPKGALHAQRVLIGHLPGVEMSHDFLPQKGDRLWTPADWAWAGGLLNILLPGLYYGVPVIAWAFSKFDPEAAFAMMEAVEVRNAFIPPTGLRLMRMVENPRKRFKLSLRSLGSGGESLGSPTFDWGREVLGLPINEFYGQTECNYVLSSSQSMGVARAGMIGKPVPGHRVAIIREDGSLCEAGERGQIAIARPDPVMFLGYWDNERATREKFIQDWLTTGDQGVMDEAGYIGFVGRDDDVITSSGYRIGPVEIEDCLLKHPCVALAAAVGKPDPVRTEIVTVFIVLKAGFTPSEALAEEIRLFVRGRLSAHEYPREVHFIEEMPLTTTGKVIRRVLRDQVSQQD